MGLDYSTYTEYNIHVHDGSFDITVKIEADRHGLLFMPKKIYYGLHMIFSNNRNN